MAESSATKVVGGAKAVAIVYRNFMCIPEARLEFDESGIINICGYNDSGKSALIRGLEVLFYDSYPNEQVRFIMDDEEFFLVGMEFEDGVFIGKYKYSNGQSVWEMRKGEDLIYTNRLQNGVAAIYDVPEVIARYLNVVKDSTTKEQLNVRRVTDKMFLINTTGGDNYKIVNTVLRYDVLSGAVKKLNEDRNSLQAVYANDSITLKTLRDQSSSLFVLDDDELNSLKENTEKLQATKERIEYLDSIKSQKESLDAFVIYNELPLIDTSRLSDLEQILHLKQQVDQDIHDECPLLDTERLQMLEEIINLREQLNLDIAPEVTLVDMAQFDLVREAAVQYNNWYKVSQELQAVENEYSEVRGTLEQLSREHGFKICPNCGTVAV